MTPDEQKAKGRWWAKLLLRALPLSANLREACVAADIAMKRVPVDPDAAPRPHAEPFTPTERAEYRRQGQKALAILDAALSTYREELRGAALSLDLPPDLEEQLRRASHDPFAGYATSDVSPDVILEPGPGQGAGTFNQPEGNSAAAGKAKPPKNRDGAGKKRGGKGKGRARGKRGRRLPKSLRLDYRRFIPKAPPQTPPDTTKES
jgi:hypothetical protein